jgi:hypothetical protein
MDMMQIGLIMVAVPIGICIAAGIYMILTSFIRDTKCLMENGNYISISILALIWCFVIGVVLVVASAIMRL